MAVLANLVVQMSCNTSALEKGIKNAQSSVGGLGKTMGTGLKIAAVAGAAGVAALAGGLTMCVKAAMESQKIMTQTNAVLASTQGVSGMTAKSVTDLANSLSKVIPIDDEIIQSTENMLLTFTRVGKDIFPQATEAALNMATALGGDPVDAALKLGKALQDPIAGVTALRRVGVMLTDQQKDQIKTMMDVGDVAGAQAVILKELEVEFGNSGRAAGQTMGGQLKILQTQFGNLQESIGMALIPILLKLASFLTEKVVPALQGLADEWVPRIQDAFTKLGDILGPVIAKITPFFETLSKNKDSVTVMSAIIGGVLVGAFLALAVAAGTAAVGVIAATWPLLAIGAAAAGLAAGIVLLVRHWDDVTAAVQRARDWFNNLPAPIKVVAIALNLPIVALIALGVGIAKLAANWDTTWNSIKAITETVINAVIGGFNFLLRGVEFVINTIIDAYNMLPGWMRGDEIKHITLQIDEIDLTPVYKAISAYNLLASLMKQVGARHVEAADDVALLQNRFNNATVAAKAFVPPLEDTGGAAGGAGDAFRGLDADLAALRSQMIATAEQGLVVLNNAIINQTDYLGALQQALDTTNTFIDSAGEHIKDLQADIDDNTKAMQDWMGMSLEGTRAFSDASFALSQQQDALQLKINSVEEALYDQRDAIEKTGYVSAGLESKIRALAKSVGMDMTDSIFNGRMSLEDINEVLDASGDKMTNLGRKASDVNLKENLQLEPLRRQLEELFNPTVEASFDEIVAGFTANRDALKGLNDELVIWNGAQVDAGDLAKFLEGRIADQTTLIDTLKTAYSDLEGKLTAIDPAIKAIWEARGEPMIKSIEDAFAAIDRGDKGAADAAMASALSLWDQIKALVPGAETGIFAPLEKVLRDVETSVDVDISGMTKTLSGNLGGVSKELVGVQEAVAGGFVAMMTNLRDWVVTLLSDIAGNVNFLGLLVDIRDDIRGLPSALAGAMPAAATALAGGGYINRSGLAYVHAGETVVPARGGSGGGDTNIYMTVQGSILSERDLKRIIAEGLRRGEFRGMGI